MNSTIDYNGHTITVTDDYRFAISGPTIEPDGRHAPIYDSLDKAKERIDQNGDAVTVTVTGIHGGHCGLLGTGFKGGYSDLYPATEAVLVMLREVDDLHQRLNELAKVLGELQISTTGPRAPTYDDAVKIVLNRIETVIKRARELEQKP